MRIDIDQGKCIGASTCVSIAPKVFRLDMDELVAYVIDREGADDETLLDAARSCPVDAIYLDTDDGKAVYPPEPSYG